jgi:peptide/nickel transport system substrate-binding protein
MIEYDPDRANELLDEMGLTERDGEGFRLTPSGERLQIVFECAAIFGPWPEIGELLGEHYKQIGLEWITKVHNRQLLVEHMGTGDMDCHMWTANGEFHLVGECRTYISFQGAAAFQSWYNTGGKEGEEPPDFMKTQWELWDEITVTVDEEKQKELVRQILEIHKENMVTIGICTSPPEVVVVKNDMRNVPEKALSDWPLLSPGNTIVEQYFIRQG